MHIRVDCTRIWTLLTRADACYHVLSAAHPHQYPPNPRIEVRNVLTTDAVVGIDHPT